ncbi:hypothetical protein KAU32_13235 [bacterium]|nr:hypothetical protein [bacterium]
MKRHIITIIILFLVILGIVAFTWGSKVYFSKKCDIRVNGIKVRGYLIQVDCQLFYVIYRYKDDKVYKYTKRKYDIIGIDTKNEDMGPPYFLMAPEYKFINMCNKIFIIENERMYIPFKSTAREKFPIPRDFKVNLKISGDKISFNYLPYINLLYETPKEVKIEIVNKK